MTGMVLQIKPSGFPQAAAGYPAALRRNVNRELGTIASDIVRYAQHNHQYISRKGNADQSIGFHHEYDRLAVLVGFDIGVALHGLFLNDGTKPHQIVPIRAKALQWVGAGGRFTYARKVRHPGTKAMRFVENAARVFEPKIEGRLMAAVARTSAALAGATGGKK